MPEDTNNQQEPKVRRVYLSKPQQQQNVQNQIDENKITNLLSALDDVDNKLFQFGKNLDNVNKNLDNVNNNIFQTLDVFELFTDTFSNGINTINIKLKNFYTSVESADLLLVSSFIDLIDQNTEFNTMFGKIKQSNDLFLQSISQLNNSISEFITSVNFTSIFDNMNLSIMSQFDKLNMAVDDFISSTKITSMFDNISLSIMSQVTKLNDIVNDFALFTKNISIFDNIRLSIISQADKLNIIVNDFSIKFADMYTQITDVTLQLTNQLSSFLTNIDSIQNKISSYNIASQSMPLYNTQSSDTVLLDHIMKTLTDIKELLQGPQEYINFKYKQEIEKQSKIGMYRYGEDKYHDQLGKTATGVGAGLQGAVIGSSLGKTLLTKWLPMLGSSFLWIDDIVKSLGSDIPTLQKVLQSLFGSVEDRGRGVNALVEAQKWGLLGFTIAGPWGALVGQGVGQALGQIGQDGLTDIGNAIKETFTGIKVSEDEIGKYLEEIQKDPRYQKLTATEQQMLQEEMQKKAKRPIVYQIRNFGSSIAEEVKNWGRRFQNLISNDIYYTQEELEKELFNLKVQFPELSEEELYEKQLENLKRQKTFAGFFEGMWEDIKNITTKIGHGIVTWFRMGIPTEKEIRQKMQELEQEFPDLSEDELRSLQLEQIDQERPFFKKSRDLFNKALDGLKNIGNSIKTFFFGNKITDDMINERVNQLREEFPELSERELQATQIYQLEKENVPEFGQKLEYSLTQSLNALKNMGLNIKAFFTRNKITDDMVNERVNQLRDEFPDLKEQELKSLQLDQLAKEYKFPFREKLENLWNKSLDGLKNIGNSIRTFFFGNKITDDMVNERVNQLRDEFPDLSERELRATQIQQLENERLPIFGQKLEQLWNKSLTGLKNIGNSIKNFFFKNKFDKDVTQDLNNLTSSLDTDVQEIEKELDRANNKIFEGFNNVFKSITGFFQTIASKIKDVFTFNKKHVETEISNLSTYPSNMDLDITPKLLISPEDLASTQIQQQSNLNNIIIKQPPTNDELIHNELSQIQKQNEILEQIYNVLKENGAISQEQLDNLFNKTNPQLIQNIDTTVIPNNSVTAISVPPALNEQLP